MENYALISVQDKNKLYYICKILKKYKINILSTGGTSDKIKKLGFSTKKIKDITNFNEILDGRVKTLHPKIHGGILYDRKNPIHKKIIKKSKIPTINYVIVNLYKFKKTVKENKTHDECLENIDIGGHSLIRSAAKNYKYVNVLTNIKDYNKLEKELKKNKGETSFNFKKNLAKKAYKLIYDYDLQINKWFNKNDYKIKNKKFKKLKYGENPHQKASILLKGQYPNFDKLYGNEISYNNVNDVISAISCLNDLPNTGVVIVKHANPCGVACHSNISKALKKALKSDTRSSYGGVVALNKNIDDRIVKIFKNIFLDIIIAPNFTKDALNILKKKKVIILKLKKRKKLKTFKEIKSIPGGYLKQDFNNVIFNKKILKCVTTLKSTVKYIDDMIFAFIVAKHVKSNAIVLANDKQVVGIGAGQMSRVDAIDIALNKMRDNFGKMNPFVFASDGFLPFADNITLLKNTKCKGIIQPGGSKNDEILIKKANTLGIPMYFTGIRHFKH